MGVATVLEATAAATDRNRRWVHTLNRRGRCLIIEIEDLIMHARHSTDKDAI